MSFVGSWSLTSTSNTDIIRVVSRDVKAGFIGLATSTFGHSAERIINVNSFQNKHLLTNRGISKITLCSNDSLSVLWHIVTTENRSTSEVDRLPKSMCNPKDNLVRMIRTMFGIGTIRKCMCGIGIGSGS